jgi:hypothetical protein
VPRPPLRLGARAVDVDDRCDLACDSGPGERGEEHERGRHVEVEPLARVAIQREAGRLGLPPLDWLGPAMSPGDDIEALIEVDELRRGLSATRADRATLHLGEAEAIYVLERYHQDWTFVSDDQPAIDSEAVLAGCYAPKVMAWAVAAGTAGA